MTIDGAIVANFITAGTMLADRIKGGTLELGGRDNGNGVAKVRDAAGNEIVRLDKGGVYSTGHYVSDNPNDAKRVDMYNGTISFLDYKGNEIELSCGMYGEDKAMLSIRGKTKDGWVAAPLFQVAPGMHSVQNKYVSVRASDRSTLATPKFFIGDLDRVYEGKTGRAEFSDGTYLNFVHGVCVGGYTEEGGAF